MTNTEPKGNGTEFDPRVPFDVAGITYYLDADPDTPRLWKKLGGQGAYQVAQFTGQYHPLEVLIAALQDRREEALSILSLHYRERSEKAKQELFHRSGRFHPPTS